KATNSFGSTERYIGLTWALPPRVTMPPNASLTFRAGVWNSIVLTTPPGVSPATPVQIAPTCVTPPAWLTLTDNHDGTAPFPGTPPGDLSGSPVYNLHLRLLTIGLEGFIFDL